MTPKIEFFINSKLSNYPLMYSYTITQLFNIEHINLTFKTNLENKQA